MRMNNVLIVEDDASARSGLAELVTHAGFHVTTAADGREALDKMSSEQHDVVLLDMWMPNMDGLQVLRELKAKPAGPKVIVMTGDDTPETVLLSLRQDAYQFINKPIQPQKLLQMLQDVPNSASPSIVVLSARAGWVELLVPCTEDTANRIETYIGGLEADLPDELRASIGLMFRELLLDAMSRDGWFDAQRRVRMSCLRARRMLMFRIADAGYGFRAGDQAAMTQAQEASHPSSPGEAAAADAMLRPGLLMAKQLADEVLVNEAGDEVVAVKYLD